MCYASPTTEHRICTTRRLHVGVWTVNMANLKKCLARYCRLQLRSPGVSNPLFTYLNREMRKPAAPCANSCRKCLFRAFFMKAIFFSHHLVNKRLEGIAKLLCRVAAIGVGFAEAQDDSGNSAKFPRAVRRVTFGDISEGKFHTEARRCFHLDGRRCAHYQACV